MIWNLIKLKNNNRSNSIQLIFKAILNSHTIKNQKTDLNINSINLNL